VHKKDKWKTEGCVDNLVEETGNKEEWGRLS